MWKLVTFLLGFVPNIIKFFQRKAKVNDAKNIDKIVTDGNDSAINKQLSDIVTKADDNAKANS